MYFNFTGWKPVPQVAPGSHEAAPLALTVRTTQNLDKCAEFFGVLWIETKLPPYPHLDQGWAKPGNC